MSTARNMNSRPSTEFAGRGRRSILEIDTWIPSKISAISPLVERLMLLIEGSHCITGEEAAIELALREALNNAVVHGNRLDAQKLVHVRCRCAVGKGISITVSDQGAGFDPNAVPDPLSVENLMAEHGRGIRLMKLAMDEVSFERRGSEVHLWKGRSEPETGALEGPKESATSTSKQHGTRKGSEKAVASNMEITITI